MKCDRCDEQASVHLTQVVDGQMRKMHLCPSCAAEMGVTEESGFSMSDVLLGQGVAQPLASVKRGARCPECGMTFARFRKQGRLGCPACYEAFDSQLEPVLQSMHHAVAHTGRRPRHRNERMTLRARTEELENRLADAVAAEAYEDAARLRDELDALRAEETNDGESA